jgi:hypothetical protein
MRATIPHNCGRARLLLHTPEALGASDALCVASDSWSTHVAVDEAADLPANVFGLQVAADRKTVSVVVGSGLSQLRLARCTDI